MPSVKVRFEKSKLHNDRGSVYYRIYYGHNRRMEFAARIILPVEVWDVKQQCIRENVPGGHEALARISHDVELLNRMIQSDEKNSSAEHIYSLMKQFKNSTEKNVLNLCEKLNEKN